MFEPSRPRAARQHAGYALISVIVHAVVVATCVVIPMTRTATLPSSSLRAPGDPAPIPNTLFDATGAVEVVEASETQPRATLEVIPAIDRESMIAPTEIPSEVAAITDDRPVAPGRRIAARASRVGTLLRLGVVAPNGESRTGPPRPAPAPPPPPPSPPVPSPPPVRVSAGVIQGNLIERVAPEYPELARRARIEGTVVLEGTVNRSGEVQDLQVVQGHDMLVGSALEAVGQWRYEPYLLNGQPIDVVTFFSIVFRLD